MKKIIVLYICFFSSFNIVMSQNDVLVYQPIPLVHTYEDKINVMVFEDPNVAEEFKVLVYPDLVKIKEIALEQLNGNLPLKIVFLFTIRKDGSITKNEVKGLYSSKIISLDLNDFDYVNFYPLNKGNCLQIKDSILVSLPIKLDDPN